MPVRLLTRIVLACAFQASMVWRRAFGGDHLSAMAWPTIDLANIEFIFAHEGLFQLFLDGKFPDSLRRPISVRGLGARLGHDVETVRRSSKRLIERGLCERPAAGMIVRSSSYGIDYIETASQQTESLLRSMYGELERWSVDFPALLPLVLNPCPWDQEQENVQIGRRLRVLLLLDSIVRYATANMLIFERNLGAADAFLCIFNENNRPLLEDDDLALKYALLDPPVPDALRRPASIRSIARAANYPAETTRRYVSRLVEIGLVERRGEGLVIPTEVTLAPAFLKISGDLPALLLVMTEQIHRIVTVRPAKSPC
ncbi:MAG: hypothetical protein Q7V13_06260 [Phenylobacterium sp.]|uniref:hypothetical protein n=1 Tax=Phenylobacterium sp. TaxID=1871053 RepID=UPI002725CF57|nr:hypothetical protein [Phenylobacterium sp.]MDO8911429.1 hypothetical protein [Phenylobacterium sp.]